MTESTNVISHDIIPLQLMIIIIVEKQSDYSDET